MIAVRRGVALALLVFGLSVGVALAQVTQFILPGDNLFPEGIAAQAGTGNFYVGSTTSGQILRGDVNTPQAAEFLPGGADGRTDVRGLKVDGRGRLYAAGGATGQMFVYDVGSKALLAKFATGATPTFVNDVAVAPNGDAYFTDSQSPFIYRVASDVASANALEKIDVGGSIPYAQGFNLNGIVVSPDGKYVVTVQSNTGKLWRMDTTTRQITEVDLGGETVQGGDGMLLDGQTLHVMRNAAKELVTFRTSPDLARATLVTKTTDPAWDFPTTFAQSGNRLLILNSQLNKRTANQPPTLPFTAVTAPIPGATPTAMPTTGGESVAWLWLAGGALLTLAGLLARRRRHQGI